MSDRDVKIMVGGALKMVRAGVLPPLYVAAIEELADQILGWQ